MIKKLALVFSLLASPGFAQVACNHAVDGYTLDWNNYNWPGPNQTSGNFVVTRPDGSDPVTVGLQFTNATGFFYNGLNGFPQVSNLITGGYGAGAESLAYLVNFDNTSRVIDLNVSFSTVVQDVEFDILDIDYGPTSNGFGGFRDNVVIQGQNLTVSTARFAPDSIVTPYHSLPTTTQSPSTVELFSGNLTRARGLGTNALPDEDLGNVTAAFNTEMNAFRIRYGNSGLSSSNPGVQGIALYDVKFCIPRHANISATKEVVVHSSVATGCGTIPGTPEAGLPPALPGACMEYEITVNNSGDGAATGLDLVDVLNGNLIYRGSSISGFVTTGPGYTEITPSVGADCGLTTCNIGINNGGLEPGDTGSILIRVEIKS